MKRQQSHSVRTIIVNGIPRPFETSGRNGPYSRSRHLALLMCSAFSLSLGACGGGGIVSTPVPPSGDAPSDPIATPLFPETPTPTPTPAPTPAPAPQAARSIHDDAEYRANYAAAESVGALYALENGWDGKGVLVGVLDEGVVETAELEGQISDLSRDFGGVRENGVTRPHELLGDDGNSRHGTLVASIIAARNDGEGVQGLAPGAEIVVLRSDLQDLDTGKSYVGVNGHDAIRYAGENGVMIVNRSLSKVIPELANRLMQDAVADYRRMGGLVINAAGNSGGPDPNDAIDLTPENREGWLFVVAAESAGESYELASYSNRCGTAMDRCVAGMGTSVAADTDGSLVQFSGTSAATPQASALAALILHKWPQLSGVDAGNIILATAQDIGAEGVDSTFGHGLISVEGALSPIEPMLSNGLAASPVAASSMVLPEAIAGEASGAGEAIQAALSEVTILDAFGRDFEADLSGLVADFDGDRGGEFERKFGNVANLESVAFQAESIAARVAYVGSISGYPERNDGRLVDAELVVGLADRASRITAAFRSEDRVEPAMLGLAPTSDVMRAYFPRDGASVAFSRDLGGEHWGFELRAGARASASGAGLLAWYGRKRTTIKFGLLDERGSVFGTPTGAGALRFGDGARTVFAELSTGLRLGNWALGAAGSFGVTQLKLDRGTLLTDAAPVTTGRLGLTLARPLLGGRATFSIAQPLVALSGSGSVTFGSGYDAARQELQFATREIDLSGNIAPRLAVGFEKVGQRSRLRLGMGSRLDGGGQELLGTWRLRFK